MRHKCRVIQGAFMNDSNGGLRPQPKSSTIRPAVPGRPKYSRSCEPADYTGKNVYNSGKGTGIASKLREMACENWHIHSNLSNCANPEMTPANIVAMAEEFKLDKIAIVDHHHPRENGLLEKIEKRNAALSEIKTDVKVITGAELSAFGPGKYADDLQTNACVGFRLYACNHYHHRDWEHPETRTPDGYIQHSLDTTRQLIASGRADCIAHPLLVSYIEMYKKNPSQVTSKYLDTELTKLFELSNTHNVAWELSIGKLLGDMPFAKRFIRLGMESGVTFKMGTDAHRLYQINPKPQIEYFITEMEKS